MNEISTLEKGRKRGRKPGTVKTGGRTAGTPNKVTSKAKMAIAMFVDQNADRLQEWIDQIAENDGPRAAFGCFVDLIEYHVPKLARHEVAGDPERPVVVAGLNAQEFEELAAKAAREV